MRYGQIVAAVLLLVPSGLDAAEGPQIEQQAIDIARKSAEFLASRPAMAFNWFVSYDEVQGGREKITFMRSGSNLLIRDKGFYSHVENEDGIREYFFDGKSFTVAAPDEAFYASGDFDGTYEDLIDAYRAATGSDLPLYGLMSRTLPDGLFDGLDGAAYLGITRIAGREVHHLAFSDYDEDWQIWISTDDAEPVPLVIVGTNPYEQGWPQYRTYLTQWDFDPDVVDGTFSFTPAPEDEKIDFPDLTARTGADAKSSEAARAGGSSTSSGTPPVAGSGVSGSTGN